MTAPLEIPAADAPAEEWGRLAMQIPGWCEPPEDLPSSWLVSFHNLVPDPDHWAWEGWFLRLLGKPAKVDTDGGWRLWTWGSPTVPVQPTLGRAAIAAAAALGRWPGGEG